MTSTQPRELGTSAILPIIEPLSRATGDLMKPADLMDSDYLLVDVDDDLRFFTVEAKSFKPFSGVLTTFQSEAEIVAHNGQRLIPTGYSASNNASSRWVGRVPERKELGFGKWRLAATDFTAIVMHYCWPEDKVMFLKPQAALTYKHLLQRFTSQTHGAIRIARYKADQVAPPLPEDYVSHPDIPSLPHQHVGVLNSLHGDYLLLMDPGTCKTSTSIMRVMIESARKRAGEIPGVPKTIYRVLVVCPGAVRLNWQMEFQKFATVPGKVTVLRGDDMQRGRMLIDVTRDEPDCVWSAAIISYDSVEGSLSALKSTPFDLVIADEIHWCKNSRTNRWKNLMRLVNEGHVRHRQGLTGTPIANSIMDLWALLEFLGDGYSGFLSFKAFSAFHGKYERIENGIFGNPIQKLVGLKNIPLLQERLARMAYVCSKEDAGLNLPEKYTDVVEVEMTSQQAKYYKTIKEQLALELTQLTESDSPKRMSANHVLTKLLRLAHITSGFVRWDEVIDPEGNIVTEGKTEAIPGENPKIEAMTDLIMDEDRDPLGKIVIWCKWKHDIAAVCDRLSAEGRNFVMYNGDCSEAEREGAVMLYNSDPTVTEMVGSPATAGTGLNLLGYVPEKPELVDTYTNHMIVFSQGWSALERMQLEDRAHRMGSRCRLRITDLTVPGTVDEEIRKRVTGKRETASLIQNLSEILKSVLDFHLQNTGAIR